VGESPVPERRGLVLDDYLGEVRRTRRQFKLATPAFGLPQVEKEEEEKEAVRRLIHAIVERHADEIYSAHHPLLDEVSPQVYSDRVSEGPYPRPRISSSWTDRVLRRLLEIGLQTIVQLPPRLSTKPGHSSRDLKLLAAHFGKLAEEANRVLADRETRERALKYFSSSGVVDSPDRLLRLAPEMSWAAGTLNAVLSRTKVTLLRADSPNPQVRLALYLVGWLEHATGSQQYEPLGKLIAAAFAAVEKEKEPPKWVDRLAIEMLRKRRRREAYAAKVLFSGTVHHSAPTSTLSIP
jgi:hypothetical protein